MVVAECTYVCAWRGICLVILSVQVFIYFFPLAFLSSEDGGKRSAW